MNDPGLDGYATPEEAGRGDIPPRFVRVIGVEIDGDDARVSLPTNEAPRFEPYQQNCQRRGGQWFAACSDHIPESGSGQAGSRRPGSWSL